MNHNIHVASVITTMLLLVALNATSKAETVQVNFRDSVALPAVDATVVTKQQIVDIDPVQFSDNSLATINTEDLGLGSVDIQFHLSNRLANGELLKVGQVAGYLDSSVVMVIDGERLSGELVLDGETFHLRTLSDGHHVLQKVTEHLGKKSLIVAKALEKADVLNLTNLERAKSGLPALTSNSLLEQAAQGHAEDMAQNGYFDHISLDERTLEDRINATGYSWNSIAENIAAGYTTASSVVTGWINSPGHYANIMSSSVCELGVGYTFLSGSPYRHYWVQNFGRQSGLSACPTAPAAMAPDVVANAVIPVDSNSVKLTGTVNPNGLSTTYYYQLGHTTAYGSASPSYNAGSGRTPLTVELAISDLIPGVTYHYRIVAVNNLGTTYSNDIAFSVVTSPSLMGVLLLLLR